MSSLKEKVLEIVEIAKECPENLQVICFELLLKDHLAALPPKPAQQDGSIDPAPGREQAGEKAEPSLEKTESPPEDIGKGQDDLSERDLHVKVRHFLEKNNLGLGEVNNLFYKENNQILPLYDDLKTTRLAESQVRIALLLAFHQAIQTGTFESNVEAVRKDCTDRKAYDGNNWSNNFTNNAGLFDFAKFNKSITTIRLSEQGKKELAELIRDLQ